MCRFVMSASARDREHAWRWRAPSWWPNRRHVTRGDKAAWRTRATRRQARHEAVQHGTLVGNTGAMLTEVIPRLCNEVAEPDEVIAPMS